MRYLVSVVLIVLILSTLWKVETKKVTKRKTKTHKTKLEERKMKYCMFKGEKILPNSTFSSPQGCVECTCNEEYLICKKMAKGRKKKMQLGCF